VKEDLEQELEHQKENRRCNLCSSKQPIENFYLSHGVPMSRCKECHKKEVHIWRVNHRSRVQDSIYKLKKNVDNPK